MSWDRAPAAPHAVLVVHRLPNAMLAELLLLDGSERHRAVAVGTADATAEATAPRVLARDGRVEYCKPLAAFLADGRIVARLNLARGAETEAETEAEVRAKGAEGHPKGDVAPTAVTHGLWLLDPKELPKQLLLQNRPTVRPVPPSAWAKVLLSQCPELGPTLGEHGGYDLCSTSYGNAHGVREGFVLDPTRQRMAFTARPHDPAHGMSDRLYLIDFEKGPEHANIQQKGCYVPVALAEGGDLVYHFRSPTEAGDLWKCTTWSSNSLDASSETSADRLTHTMPPALRAKLSAPDELVVGGRHVLLFRPPPDASGAPKPALVWAHGGPMTAVGFDYNPIAAWRAQRGRHDCVAVQATPVQATLQGPRRLYPSQWESPGRLRWLKAACSAHPM